MRKDSSLEFYQDTLVIQAAFGDALLMKQAEEGVTDSIISAVKGYIGNHMKPDDSVGSVINILAPGFVTVMLRSLGLGWLSFVAGLAMEIFHVDVASIIQSALSSILPTLKSGAKVTAEEVKGAVEKAFGPEENKEPTKEEVQQFEQKGVQAFTVREALLYKFAMTEAVIEYKLTKNAGIFDLFGSGRKGTVSLLSKAVKWIFMIVLASAGLMVAGDVVNKIVGRPNAFDGNVTQPQPAQQQAPVTSVSKQTKFKVSPSYDNKVLNSGSSTWVESVPANNANIIGMVLDWMNEVYDGTEQYENAASSSPGFRNVVQEIADYNSGNTHGKITYIPRMFPTKKHAVDVFIDDVAKSAGPGPTNFPAQKPGSIYV